MVFFTQQDIQTITLGPGKKSVIHKENEYVEVDKVLQAVDVYKNIIWSF